MQASDRGSDASRTATPASSLGTPAKAPARAHRATVDLSAYPDLTVVFLGFRVSGWRSFLAVAGIGRKLDQVRRNKPDGLLVHETVMFGFNHIGMRQYWRDFDSMERFTRTDPHKAWWGAFSNDTRGAGFWHETYRRSGGVEGLYINMPTPIGLAAFAPAREPSGQFQRARQRLAA